MNPYKVLGVNENASQEEIRAAYLELVKKYNPDKYADNPLKELAGEKLKEINQAYEMLTKKQTGGAYNAGGYGSSGSSTYGYGQSASSGSSSYGRGSPYSGPNAAEFARARSFINQNNLTAARDVLDGVSAHNAEWNYLYGIIYLRQGWYEKAQACITRAYEMEPDNAEYRRVYTSLNNSGRPYTRAQGSVLDSDQCCNACSLLMCLNCCCGGDCC